MPKVTLDAEVLKELLELNTEPGEDILGDLARLFATQSPVTIAAMRSSLASGDRETFRRSAHSLKSTAGALGATNLSELCRTLEEGSANLADEENRQRIDQIEAEVAGVSAALQEYLR